MSTDASPKASVRPEESDLRALWAPIWNRKWLILFIVVIATTGTYVYYDRQPDVYESSTVLLVAGGNDVATALQGLPATQGNDRNLENQAVLLKTRPVAQRVAKEIDYRGDPASLLDSVTSAFESGKDFLTITASAGSPARAAQLADAFSRAFINLRAAQTRGTIQDALAEAQKQLDGLGDSSGAATQRLALRQTIANLRATLGTESGSVRQLDPAAVPGTPTSPRPKRGALFAFFVSLALGAGLAFLLSRLDRRLKHTDEIRDAYGLPLISVIPHVARPGVLEEGRPVVNKSFHEAFRGLHANLRLLTLDSTAKTILITSAMPGEGKSTIARNLALVYREWGLRVALVEADLRRPVLAESLGIKPKSGLTNVLTGSVDIDEAFVDIDVDVAGLETLAAVASAGRGDGRTASTKSSAGSRPAEQNGSFGALRLLAAGPQPANPQAVIASVRMREVLEEIASRHDVLVIDSSPLLAVSDALPILSMVDVCVLVARVGISTRDAAQRVIEVVGRSPNAGVMGVVANDLPGGGAVTSTYGYGYGYGYTDASEKSSRAGRGAGGEVESRDPA